MLSLVRTLLVMASTLYTIHGLALPSASRAPVSLIMPHQFHPRSHFTGAASIPIFGSNPSSSSSSSVPPSARGGYMVTRRGASDRSTPAYASSRGGQGFDLSNWTNRLLALNTAIFLLQQVYPGVTLLGAKNDKLIRMGEYHRLFTPMLLHANLQHLMANSYSMYNIGHFIEPVFGGSTYLALYVISGFCGNAMSFVTGTAPISIGASTAVSGLMGALGFFCLRHREMFNLEGPLRSVFQAVVINGVLGASSRNIDNFGHLGGLIGGVLCGMTFGPRLLPVTNQFGQYLGLANRPYLQSAMATMARNLRRRGLLPGGKGGRRRSVDEGGMRGNGRGSPSSPSSIQKKKAGGWLSRLGNFLSRGDSSSGGPSSSPYGRAAFIASPTYQPVKFWGGSSKSLIGGCRGMPPVTATMMRGRPFAATGISFAHHHTRF